jgi:tetratricopeptide (TPR) repeat protein
MLFDDISFGPYDKAERKAYLAFELYEDGKIAQAISELDAALEINPANSAWHFNKALALDAVGLFDDAIAEYEIALQANPFDLEILNSLAVDYTRIGQYDLAISTFEHLQQLDPSFEPCYCNRIITYTEMGLHDLAEEMFYLAQQLDPDCALCYYNIGNSIFARSQYKKAVSCWLKTAELDPAHPEINYRLAQASWACGDKDNARHYFLAELRLNPGSIDVILDFGLFLLQTGCVESAKEKFNRILELAPDSAVALFYLGEIAFGAGDYEHAAKLFNDAILKDGTLVGPRYRLAQYAIMKGQSCRAKKLLIYELNLTPEDSDVLTSMGSMFLMIDEKDYAVNCLLKAVDADHANAQAYYYLGLANAVNNRLESAAEFFAHALDIKPEYVDALRDSAIVSLAMGRIDSASEKVKKAINLSVDDPRLKALDCRIKLIQRTERIIDFFGRFQRFFSGLQVPASRKRNCRTRP